MYSVQGILDLLKLACTGDARIVAYRARMKLRRIDLRSATVAQLETPPERCEQYANSGGPDLDVVLKTLPIMPTDNALDLGCGKGGAILTMATYRFGRVDGVEISPQMARIARENCRRLGITNSEVFITDAAHFKGMPGRS